jgi:hypothetical protein
MAWVPRYFYDVFLSYAHVDNEGSDKWVSRFKAELEHQLHVNLGAWGDRRASVWWDENRVKPGYVIGDAIKQALARTAAVVSLYSPGRLASGYCAAECREFETLCGAGIRVGSASRLLNVILRQNADVRQATTGSSLYADFTRGGVPLSFDSADFATEMGKLASALAELLTAMRQQFPSVYVSLQVEPGSGAGQKTIEMLNALSTAGYRRTSEIHPLNYHPDRLQEEIRGALLSVHVVDDPADDLALRQIRAAAGAGKPMLVLLSDPVRRSPAAEEIYKIVPGKGREVTTEYFSEFRDRVVQKMLPLIVSGRWPEPASTVRTRKSVFFLYHPQKDVAEAASVLRRLQNDFEVTRQGGPTGEADAVLVYQKEAGDRWFETKLSAIKEMRGVKAAWPVPPPDKGAAQRAASDFKFKHPAEIDRSDPRILLNNADPDPLQPFVDLVKGAPAAGLAKANPAT